MALTTIPTTGLWSVVAGYLNGNFNSNADNTASLIDVLKTKASFGNTVKTNATLAFSITGTGDTVLPPPDSPQPTTGGNYANYEKITGFQEIASNGYLTVVSGEIVVGVGGAGSYHSTCAWLDISSSANSNNVGFIFGIERSGQYYFSQRVTGTRASAQNDQTNVSGGGVLELEEGDKLSVWVAAELNSVITIYDCNLSIQMNMSTALEAL